MSHAYYCQITWTERGLLDDRAGVCTCGAGKMPRSPMPSPRPDQPEDPAPDPGSSPPTLTIHAGQITQAIE